MTGPSDSSVRRADWLLVAVLSLGVFCIAQRHAFFSPCVINDDLRQQLYWMARWLDASLYPPDLLGDYSAAYVPVGLKALYYPLVAGLGIDPLLASKLVSGGLFVLLALSLFGLGIALEGRTLGFFTAAMAWLMPFFLKNISGGLSRGFAGPLLALFLLVWVRRRDAAMAAVLLVQALCIPYIAILCAGCACLDAVWGRLTDRAAAPFPARPWHGVVLAVAAGLVWVTNRTVTGSDFGPLVGHALLSTQPEFTAAGRLELFPLPNPFFDLIYWPFESIGLFLDIGLFTGIASLVMLAPVVVYGARRTPWLALAHKARPAVMLLAGSLALYLMARAVALLLFVPDRYISYSINLLYALLLAIVLRHALSGLLARRLSGAVLILLAVGLGAWRLTNVGLYDYTAEEPLYAAIRELPKDALIAGNPEVLDNVLTFGRRNVVASFELAHPWSQGYWRRYMPRLGHQAEAYYAKDAATVIDFARFYGVTHIVVREADFTPAALAGDPLFAPFTARIRELAALPGNFVLLDETKFPYTSPEPGIRLVDMRPYTAQAVSP